MTGHTFEVYTKIRGQGRPKVAYGKRMTYKAKADREYEEAIKVAYINSNGPWFGEKPITIKVDVWRQLPKSAPKRIEWEPDTHKPDASNILKSVEDALNGIAYKDDCQILEARCRKWPRRRGHSEYMVITIEEVPC